MNSLTLGDIPDENPVREELWTYFVQYGVLRIVAVSRNADPDCPLVGLRRENDPICWSAMSNHDDVYVKYEDAKEAALAAGWDGVSRLAPAYRPTTIGEGGAYIPDFS